MDTTTPTTTNGDTNMDNIDYINESFKQLLARGDAVIRNCRQLMEENARLLSFKEEVDKVCKEHGILSVENLRLYLEDCASVQKVMDEHGIELEDADALREKLNGSSEPADNQTLKYFKGEIDAIHEEFDIPKDVDALRKDLQMAKSIKEAIADFTDIDLGNEHAVANIREALEEYHDMKEACDNHVIEYADLDSTLEEKAQYDNVLSDHNITDASELDDTLTDMEDAEAYEKGFNELAEFVEKFKEFIGYHGDAIPATNMEDYK